MAQSRMTKTIFSKYVPTTFPPWVSVISTVTIKFPTGMPLVLIETAPVVAFTVAPNAFT